MKLPKKIVKCIGYICALALFMSPRLVAEDKVALDLTGTHDRIETASLGPLALAAGTRSGDLHLVGTVKDSVPNGHQIVPCRGDISALAWLDQKVVLVGTNEGKVLRVTIGSAEAHPVASVNSAVRCLFGSDEFTVVGDAKGTVSIFGKDPDHPTVVPISGAAAFVGVVPGISNHSFVIGDESGRLSSMNFDGTLIRTVNVGFSISAMRASSNGSIYVGGQEAGEIAVFGGDLVQQYVFQRNDLGCVDALTEPANGRGMNVLCTPATVRVGGKLKRIEARVLGHLEEAEKKLEFTELADLKAHPGFLAADTEFGRLVVDQRIVSFVER